MERYSDSIRYLAVILAALYALAGGHLLCAPCLASPAPQCAGHICEHSQHRTPGNVTSANCCSDKHGGKSTLCNGNDFPAIVVQCSIYKLIKLLELPIGGFVSTVSAKCQPSLFGIDDAPTFCYPVFSSRLYLLYEVLLN